MGKKILLKCNNCGEDFERWRSRHLKNLENGHTRTFCSYSCRNEASITIVNCTYCGTELVRKSWKLKPESFCDTRCRHAHNRDGILVTPELKKEIRKLKRKGESAPYIAGLYGISTSTVWVVLKGKR